MIYLYLVCLRLKPYVRLPRGPVNGDKKSKFDAKIENYYSLSEVCCPSSWCRLTTGQQDGGNEHCSSLLLLIRWYVIRKNLCQEGSEIHNIICQYFFSTKFSYMNDFSYIEFLSIFIFSNTLLTFAASVLSMLLTTTKIINVYSSWAVMSSCVLCRHQVSQVNRLHNCPPRQ